MRYPGGKNAGGSYQRIINQIPPHEVYIEPFGGSAAVLRMKRPARRSIILDLNPGALAAIGEAVPPGTELSHSDALIWLARHPWTGGEFVYADPPYLHSVCSSPPKYRHTLTEAQHRDLLLILMQLPCAVAVSGYWSQLYADLLAGWRTIHWSSMTRAGRMAEEWLWMNYPEPITLHDYQYLGDTFRQREKFGRRRRRWAARLAAMDILQRRALLAALAETDPIAFSGEGGRPMPGSTPSPEPARAAARLQEPSPKVAR